MTWDRFGSPYDPSHRGRHKVTKPNQTASVRIERVSDFGSTLRIEDLDIYPRFSDQIMRDMANTLRIPFEDFAFGAGSDGHNASTSDGSRPTTPPASYRAARELVEKWIVPAPEQSFDDIIGNDEALSVLRDAVQAPVLHKALYEAYGLKMPKGALLLGPPGCGKTMFARAAASEMKRLYGKSTEMISIAGAELQSKFIGETEERIKRIFAFAREYQAFHGHPLLVFMDEAEVLLPDRSGRSRQVFPWEENQVATFLAEMDGMQASGAFVLLATNRPGVIDQAVLRDGRCDFKIAVARPTARAIEEIVRKNFDGAPIAADTKLEELVFAAVESLYDPHKILLYAHSLRVQLKLGGDQAPKVEHAEKHFLLEHIVSGAMAASIPGRSKRRAFARDKAHGIAKGITVDDVVKAVDDIFAENRGLDHAFALDDFKREFIAETQANGEE